MWRPDTEDTADTLTDTAEAEEHIDHVAQSQDTVRANHEDATDWTDNDRFTDPDDVNDADILEALIEEFDPSPTINPEQQDSAPPDHAQLTGSRSDGPVPLPPVHLEPGNSVGTPH